MKSLVYCWQFRAIDEYDEDHALGLAGNDCISEWIGTEKEAMDELDKRMDAFESRTGVLCAKGIAERRGKV